MSAARSPHSAPSAAFRAGAVRQALGGHGAELRDPVGANSPDPLPPPPPSPPHREPL
ncbi:hypothetical protein ALC56_13280 [Trachymyrmex septentrionalis]|uniref:Uncharacterized protein n=1 Tax=Trachymyrmex septentrionalis TaxID=34720 RepID=A0A195EW09_9HYME|nr:hypothetical protein ALC56_13280 [Trachymyrmex septentrionalis]